MKALLPGILALLWPACSREEPFDPARALRITTSAAQYAAGDMIVARIENRSPRRLLWAPCNSLDLQWRAETGSWRLQAGRGCALSDLIGGALPAGTVVVDSFPTALAFPPGEYRLIYDIRTAEGELLPEVTRTSNIFVLD